MQHRHSLLPLFLLAAALVLPACRSSQTPEEEEEDTSGSEDTSSRDASRDVTLTPENSDPTAEACSLSRVYFGFDADELDSASRAAIQQAVDCYRTRGVPARLHLTGATDPRGTEEYNIALGDRRAQAVRAYLVSLGIEQARIAVTSVGEEMAQGTDESGWAQDRAVSATE